SLVKFAETVHFLAVLTMLLFFQFTAEKIVYMNRIQKFAFFYDQAAFQFHKYYDLVIVDLAVNTYRVIIQVYNDIVSSATIDRMDIVRPIGKRSCNSLKVLPISSCVRHPPSGHDPSPLIQYVASEDLYFGTSAKR